MTDYIDGEIVEPDLDADPLDVPDDDLTPLAMCGDDGDPDDETEGDR